MKLTQTVKKIYGHAWLVHREYGAEKGKWKQWSEIKSGSRPPDEFKSKLINALSAYTSTCSSTMMPLKTEERNMNWCTVASLERAKVRPYAYWAVADASRRGDER